MLVREKHIFLGALQLFVQQTYNRRRNFLYYQTANLSVYFT